MHVERRERERVEGVGGKHRVKREGVRGEVSAHGEGRKREEGDRGKEDRERRAKILHVSFR